MTSPRTRLVLLLAGTTILGACMSDNEYRARSEQQTRNARANAASRYEREQGQMSDREKRLAGKAASIGGSLKSAERSERLKGDSVPFVRMAGYVVRGTDESSFLKCGAHGVHYTRMSWEAVGNLVQRYRFRATRPLAPVYFEFNARIVDDTVKVGENAYTSVVEIERVYPETPDARPACAPPPRGSLIERQLSGR